MGTATSPIDSGRSAALPLPHLVLGDWYSHGKFLIVPLTCHTTRLSSFQIIQFPSLRSLGVMLFAGLLGRIRNGGQSDRVYGGANHRIWTVYLYWSGEPWGIRRRRITCSLACRLSRTATDSPIATMTTPSSRSPTSANVVWPSCCLCHFRCSLVNFFGRKIAKALLGPRFFVQGLPEQGNNVFVPGCRCPGD